MAEEQPQPAEKKIIIDEGWKAQVQAEKEKAEKERPGSSDQSAATRQRRELPPASITFLFTTLATQALIALGALPNPLNSETERDLDQAKLFIDTLGVLDEKTRGNLTPDEKRHLEALLFDLRMNFVAAGQKQEKTP
jgi:hypothetical protein